MLSGGCNKPDEQAEAVGQMTKWQLTAKGMGRTLLQRWMCD